MSAAIFTLPFFEFPYKYKFPGQASDEVILFVTRENPVMWWVRVVGVLGAAAALLLTTWLLVGLLGAVGMSVLVSVVEVLGLLAATLFGLVGCWWVSVLWQKSLFILTTKRLVKIIYTTPFNRHNLSLPLEMIVDTGSYTKGFIQAIFRLGTFTARSAAAGSGVASDEEVVLEGSRVNRKYFYLENIAMAEDLQHYVNKLLSVFRREAPERLASFRPFIPHLKGDERKHFMQQYPEYWS